MRPFLMLGFALILSLAGCSAASNDASGDDSVDPTGVGGDDTTPGSGGASSGTAGSTVSSAGGGSSSDSGVAKGGSSSSKRKKAKKARLEDWVTTLAVSASNLGRLLAVPCTAANAACSSRKGPHTALAKWHCYWRVVPCNHKNRGHNL